MTVDIAAIRALFPPLSPPAPSNARVSSLTVMGPIPYDAIMATGCWSLDAHTTGAIEIVRASARWGPVYRGDLSAYGGDQSAADLALCGEFARLGLDGPKIDTAMRTSALYRAKWERDDYRQNTINRALSRRPAHAGSHHVGGLLAPENGQVEASTTNPPAREWLVDRMLLAGKSAVLAGLGGVSKSQLGLQLSVSVATGSPFAGRVTRAGEVLYLSGEEDRDELQRRINAAIRYHCLTQQDIDLVRDNLAAFPLVGDDIRLTALKNGALSETQFVSGIIEAACARANVRLIVLDHAGLVHGGDFSAKQDAALTMRVVNHISEVTGAVVLLLAHSPKSAVQAPEPDASIVFGSTAFVEQARGGWVMTTMSDAQAKLLGIGAADRTNYVALTGVKANYTPVGQEFWFRRVSFDEVGVLEHVTLSAPPKGGPKAVQTLAAHILQQVIGSPGRYSKTSLRDQFQRKLNGPWKASKAEIDFAVGDMLQKGQVINRPPTPQERSTYSHGPQVKHVLAVPRQPPVATP